MRAELYVPMLREGRCIGALCIQRDTPGLFSQAQVALMQTLADQAVIAVENVRLFQELQARNRELTEALDQQTATAEILRVISSSPTDLQPPWTAVAESAARLCESSDAIVFRVDGDELRPAAVHGAIGAVSNAISPGFVSGRAVLERRTIHVDDLAVAVATDFTDASSIIDASGTGRSLATPLLTDGRAHRCDLRFAAGRSARSPDRQVGLLQTFADAGRDRDRERAALPGARGAEPRADGGARAPDRHCGDPAGDLELPDGPRACHGCRGPQRGTAGPGRPRADRGSGRGSDPVAGDVRLPAGVRGFSHQPSAPERPGHPRLPDHPGRGRDRADSRLPWSASGSR